jgi:hypothetical protein
MADVGGEQSIDRPVVGPGVLGEPLQGTDGADPHRKVVAAGDRPGVVAFAVNRDSRSRLGVAAG